MALSPSFI